VWGGRRFEVARAPAPREDGGALRGTGDVDASEVYFAILVAGILKVFVAIGLFPAPNSTLS